MTKYFPQCIIIGQPAGQRKGVRKMICPSKKNKNMEQKRHNKQQNRAEQDWSDEQRIYVGGRWR